MKHRAALFALVVCLTLSLLVPAAIAAEEEKKPAEAPVPAPPKYQQLRYNEDYSSMIGQAREDPLDWFKAVPLGTDDLRATLGGQVRERFEYKNNEVFGAGRPRSDAFYLTRIRTHVDLQYQSWLRIFAEGKFAYSGDRDRPMPRLYEDHADFQNLFVDIVPWRDGKSKLVGRIGRQELLYGRQRLVSSFDWANIMRTFDGARLL